MGWREDLRPASYNGVPFSVEAADYESGRRLVRHEFAKQPIPFIEDMGKKTRQFRLTAFVLGDTYFQKRDFLKGELEGGGIGTLIHPYYGELRVSVDDFTINESAQDGGMARFSILFIESERRVSTGLTVEPDTTAEINQSADAVVAAAGDDFVETVQVESVPEYRRLEVSDEVEAVGFTLAGLDVFSRKSQEVAAYSRKVQNLISDAGALATSPLELVAAITDAVRGIQDAAENALAGLFAYQALFGITPTQSAANASAVTDLVGRIALAEAARVSTSVVWDNYSQALDARDSLVDYADEVSGVASDIVFESVEALRADIVAAIPAAGEDLPRLGTLTLSASMPSVVVAYDLYDDISRAGDIVRRNNVRHPAFVPGGVALEVLVDG